MIRYNTDEQNTMKSAYNKILDDMDLLWEKSETDNIELLVYLGKKEKKGYPHSLSKIAYLIFNDRGIKLEYRNFMPYKVVVVEKRNRLGKPSRNYDVATMEALLESYSDIREELKKEIKESIDDKNRKVTLFKSIDDQYSKEANIELTLPETLNPHSISLQQEEGKSIGEIRMGSGTIRIITNGSIVVANHEQVKVKRK